MAIRLKDIARDLGVSAVTVSKVLRNTEDISEETRERVMKRIRELNYQPNPAARALVTGRTHLVGLVVPDLVHAFFAHVAKGISRVLRQKGYGLVIASSEEDPELEREEIRQMLVRRLDVLMVASTQAGEESFRAIEEQQRRYILLDRKFAGLPANFTGTDDVEVGRTATAHLVENGCKRIAFMGGRYVSTAVDRLRGYRETLIEAGMQIDEGLIATRANVDDSAHTTGYHAMKEFLRLKDRPDGVFCYNDPMAMGAMQAMLEAGVRIPDDIALVGAGNVNYGAHLRVPLTTVDQQAEILGETAAKRALVLISSRQPPPPEEILVPSKLIVRASSRRQ